MSGAQARARLLPVVILALIALALIKIGNLWIGFAEADAAVTAEVEPPTNAAPPSPPAGEPERRLLERLAERRAALDAREAEMQTREQVLAIAERRIEERLVSLGQREAEIAALEAAQEERRIEEYSALSSAYQRMKPRDAAEIFEALDEGILVPVAAGMRTQALSGVLAEMKPEKARRLTILLADHGKAEETSQTVGPQ